MSSTRADFVHAILAAPDDDQLRLVFSDFLEENGDAEYAQFIRTQLELAKVPEYDPLWVRCWHHDRNAISGYLREKDRPTLPPGFHWGSWTFRRGFPVRVEIRVPEVFATRAAELFAIAPIEALVFRGEYRELPPNLAAICDCPYMARLRELNFSLTRLRASEIQQLQDSPYTTNLEELGFHFAGIDASGMAAVFQPPLIQRLTSLHFRGNEPFANAPLLEAIRRHEGPSRLRRLTLCEQGVYHSAANIFASPLIKNLMELNLSSSALNASGFTALAESFTTSGLESLQLANSQPGVPGIRALVDSPGLSQLRRLDLSNNRLGPVAARLLATCPALGNLRVLELNNNPLRDSGAIALAESTTLGKLIKLELMHCEIGDKGAGALLKSPILADVLSLNLIGHHGQTIHKLSEPMKTRLRERFGKSVSV